jgi:hypothetical protein
LAAHWVSATPSPKPLLAGGGGGADGEAASAAGGGFGEVAGEVTGGDAGAAAPPEAADTCLDVVRLGSASEDREGVLGGEGGEVNA